MQILIKYMHAKTGEIKAFTVEEAEDSNFIEVAKIAQQTVAELGTLVAVEIL